MDDDSTVILKSMKDLNRFLSQDRNIESKRKRIETSPCLKLDFSDTSIVYQDHSNEYESMNGSSFIKRHQQNIAGFDITKKIREKDSEILNYKTTISVLESKLQSIQSSQKKTRIEHDTEVETYKLKQLRDKEKIEELEHKIKEVFNRENGYKEEILKIKKMSEMSCAEMKMKRMQFQSVSLEKSEELHKELLKLRNRINFLEKETDEKNSQLNIQELYNKELEENVSSAQKRLVKLEETQLEIESLNIKLSQVNAKNKELQLRLDNLREQEEHHHLFENTLKQFPAIQNELAKLKEENAIHKITRVNIGLLEEKLSSAETQLRHLETKCNDLTVENASLITMRELSENYEEVIKKEFDLDYLPPVIEFIDHLHSLKKKDETVAQSLNELKASVDSHTNSKDAQEETIKSLKGEIEKNEIDSAKNAQIIKRLQRKIFLLSKERDSLKSIISSYQSEATLNPTVIEQERMTHLEMQLNDYKAEISKLEEELNQAQKMETYISKRSQEENPPKNIAKTEINKVQEVEKTISQLLEENENLKHQIEEYNLKGNYDPANTKILHFLENPLDKAYEDRKAKYDQLLDENEALKKRVKLLEEGDTLDLTQKVGIKVATDGANSKQIQELEEKANCLETRNKRIIEVFKQKSQEMREVVYRLSGYRVDLREDNHYKLSSMYAESQDDYLLFEQTSSGELQLLETSFSSSLTDLIESYLRQDHSFPAFLSALTLNLFNRQTMVQSSSDQEEEEFEGAEEEMIGEEEEEDYMGEEYEDEEDFEEHERPPSKRLRGEDEEEDEEEDEDEDELICLD